MLTKNLMRYYVQFRGWTTKRRLIVIESDDWGSIRMPNAKTFEVLAQRNGRIARDPYCRYDTLESKSDIEALSDVLGGVRDSTGRSAVITANTIMANPRFDKIKESGFTSYFYERFTETYVRYDDGLSTLNAFNAAINEGLLFPQLHGREHVHVPLWLRELRSGQSDLLHAFEHNCFGVPYHSSSNNLRKNLLASLDKTGVDNEDSFQNSFVLEGAQLFSSQFGFNSASFIAPAYTWHHSIEPTLQKVGVMNLQGLPLQYEANERRNGYSKRIHFTGQSNQVGQFYTVRNVFFEPSLNPAFDWLGSAINRVAEAFFFNKPAIISMHRLNFVGRLDQRMRDKNLKLLTQFLYAVTKRWPGVRFVTSHELSNMISNEFYSARNV